MNTINSWIGDYILLCYQEHRFGYLNPRKQLLQEILGKLGYLDERGRLKPLALG